MLIKIVMKRLSKKQKGFVKDYVATGEGTRSALKNYDLDKNAAVNSKDYKIASAISTENLEKPIIQKAIAAMLPDELLTERHLELLNKREIVKMFNGEGRIIDQPDTQAVAKGLDMAYRIKGSYATENPSSPFQVNIAVKIGNKEMEDLRQEYEDKLKAKLLI